MYVLYMKKRGEVSRTACSGSISRRSTSTTRRGSVETDEQWEYRMLDATTGTPKSEEFTRISYHST